MPVFQMVQEHLLIYWKALRLILQEWEGVLINQALLYSLNFALVTSLWQVCYRMGRSLTPLETGTSPSSSLLDGWRSLKAGRKE